MKKHTIPPFAHLTEMINGLETRLREIDEEKEGIENTIVNLRSLVYSIDIITPENITSKKSRKNLKIHLPEYAIDN